MRINYFNYHYFTEGSSRGAAAKIRSIASWLEKLGHEVDLHFRWTASKAGDEPNAGHPKGLKKVKWLRRYAHVPRRLWRNRRFFREEKKIMREFQPDVLLAVNSFCYYSALKASRKLRVPYVLFCDAPLEYEYSLFHRQYYSYPAISRRIERKNVRCADEVICISEILKGYMIHNGVPATKLHVVPNGVDHFQFKPGPKDAEIVARYNLDKKVVVGFTGSFNFFSDVMAFTDILKRICDRHAEATFLFVGKGPAGDEIEAAAKQKGLENRLVFTGAVPHKEVIRYLSAMDIVISPYRGDYLFYGSSLKLLEYMAAGKPAVVTALGQIKELVQDGYNGMLYNWDDDEAMLRKLSLLISAEELRRRLGENARRTIEADWTWEKQAAKIAGVLQQAIESRR
ncbi:MAG TPA: glycosyltransferase family 4 protein [Acidobacteriota bacterium]|nr:glycosyltransferase family 4 protein [Acidobacteriota bacterium]